MMAQAFYTGITGIQSNQVAIDVVSDNLSNISTIGYRGSEYEFSSMFESMIHTSTGTTSSNSSIGVGAQVNSTRLIQTNGSLLLSDKSTDLAIDGDGWFGVQGDGEPVYTRDGNFSFDANHDLVNLDGFYVLGTMGGNIEGDILTHTLDEVELGEVTAQEKLRFPKFLVYPPEPTTLASFIGNIGIDDEMRTMGAGVVDPLNNKNHLKLTFTKSAEQPDLGTAWDIVATTGSLDGETIYDTKTGTVNFSSSGALISNTLTTIDNNGSEVTIDLGDEFNGVIATSNMDITSSSIADGTIGGDLLGYDINRNAEVIATFSNGMQSSVGKLAVFHFQNDQGLERLNGSKFTESSNSGKPIFFRDASGQNIIGTNVVNFKLEDSNIEMSYGLTELIILQRSYDANSKSITTADQMMQKALNMDA
ncbi:MAG: flagellar hook-basal body complex protein [Campylobacterota bacterium]|nr:flagellar hook-basal body complex protein [Campylobacterota bacterium]